MASTGQHATKLREPDSPYIFPFMIAWKGATDASALIRNPSLAKEKDADSKQNMLPLQHLIGR